MSNPSGDDSIDSVRADRRFREGVEVLTILESAGYPAKIAGGAVRDRLMKLKPFDFDVATSATPDQVTQIFSAKGFKVVPTGIDHGTVTVVMKAGPVEITTLRRDVSTDGRRATVAFGKDFREDAARRDFTVNAMFEDARGKIDDYFGGAEDIKAKRLVFVGNAEERIKEDFLRILRLFRFWSKLGFKPSDATLKAVERTKEGLARVSQERVTMELTKLFQGPHCAESLQAMMRTSVASTIIPDASFDEVGSADVVIQAMPIELRLSAWLWVLHRLKCESVDSLRAVGVRLRIPNSEITRLLAWREGLVMLRAGFKEDAARMDFVDKWEAASGFSAADSLERALSLWTAIDPSIKSAANQVTACEVHHGHVRRAAIPLTGDTIMRELQIPPGPELGFALSLLKQGFRNREWADKAGGIAWLKQKRSPLMPS